MKSTTPKPRLVSPDVYEKSPGRQATVGEAQQVAQQAVIPAFIAARFALIVSILSVVLSAVAIALGMRR